MGKSKATQRQIKTMLLAAAAAAVMEGTLRMTEWFYSFDLR